MHFFDLRRNRCINHAYFGLQPTTAAGNLFRAQYLNTSSRRGAGFEQLGRNMSEKLMIGGIQPDPDFARVDDLASSSLQY